jgi:L-asparagine transporter-like permease
MPQTGEAEMSSASQLRCGLSQRQLNMIALGGVIGAGLFVGSGVIIGETGPGAFITCAVCGVFVVLVMRMLGEMATANPSTGSFADYARQALGGWAGFSVVWLYWYFWVVVVGFEAIAGGAVLSYWITAPLWLLSLILMVGMTATNLFSVATFGEFEFWFAGIKVAAIVIFLGLGSLFVLGAWPRHGIDFSNLTAHGGFFPHGVGAIFGAVSVVTSAMVGAEVATIAAAETANPERAVARATLSQIVLRRRTPLQSMRVKMWFFPGLSVLTLVGIVGLLVSMALDPRARTELWLGLLSWAVVLVLYFVPRWRRGPAKSEPAVPTGKATRVLVLANKNVSTNELFDVVRRVDAQQCAEYFICVPVSPVDTGQAERTGPVFVRDATVAAAHERLDAILTAVRDIGLSAGGELGDYRPLRALAAAVQNFQPDHLVIAEARPSWLRLGLVDRARAAYPIPVTHVVSGQRAVDPALSSLRAT